MNTITTLKEGKLHWNAGRQLRGRMRPDVKARVVHMRWSDKRRVEGPESL